MLNKLTATLAAISIGSAAAATIPPDQIGPAIPNEIKDPTYAGFQYNPWESDFFIGIVRVLDATLASGYKDIMMYSGPIKENSTEVIKFFIEQYPEITEITLNSPGGVAYESFEMGAYFSERGLSTTVSPGKICLSSCAIAFMGGTDYKIDGVLGFHTAWLSLGGEVEITPEMLNQSYRSGQMIGSQLSYYLRVNGFHDFLTLQINSRTDKDKFLSFTHEDELNEWYVRNDNGIDELKNYVGPLPEGIEDRIKIMDGPAFIAHMQDPANIPTGHRLRVAHTAKLVYPLPKPDGNTIGGK